VDIPSGETPILKESVDLLASFAGREIVERFKTELGHILRTIDRNDNLTQYFLDVKSFILDTKSEQQVISEEFKQHTKFLIQQGRQVFTEFSQNEFRTFLRTCQDLLDALQQDSFIQILSQQAGIIRSDLTYTDSSGKTQIDTQMLSKLQTVLLPILADALKYIPIPRMASSTRSREFWLDNIVLCIYDILPENILLHFESDSHLSLRELQIKGSQTHLIIELDRIITELKDMDFYYKKKKFPEFSEGGKVSIRLKGQGARLRIIFSLTQESNQTSPRLSQGVAQFQIMDMDIKFDKSTLKHDILVPMLQKMFKKAIQQKIEKEVENNLSPFIFQLGDSLTTAIGWMTNLVPNFGVTRDVIKSSELGLVFEKRKEKIE